MNNKKIYIPAINCDHCVATIERELSDLEGVISVKADSVEKKAEISWKEPLQWESIKQLLHEINFPPSE